LTDLRDQIESGLRGSYTIERELGRGGMATVFLAQDLKHKRPVALKVLLLELTASVGAARFNREIKLRPGSIIPTSSRCSTRAKLRASSGSRCRT